MSRPRPHPAVVWRGLAGVLTAWVVLLGSVEAGLSTSDWELLAAVRADGGLDYTRVAGTVAPLTEAFIAQALGLPPPTPTVAATDAVASAPPVDEPAPITAPAAPSSDTPADVSPGTRVTVTHPPDNDAFAQAYEVPSVPFTATTTAASASRQGGEPGACSPVGPTLWYRYTAPRTTGLVATTVGTSGAASLGVFTGSGLDDLRRVGCDTDLGGDAHVAFEAVAGSTYFFQITRPARGGATVFTLDPAGVTERISLNSDGEQVDSARYWMGATSADGRYVAFQSLSSELVPEEDTNAAWDVFVKDRVTGAVERVSVASDGTEGNDHSWSRNVDISADGRFVAFYSWASNLVPDDTNDQQDAFVHDRATGETRRVSVSSSGGEGEWFAAAHFLLTPGRADCQLRPRDAPLVGHQATPCFEWGAQVSMTADGSVVVFESALLGHVDGEEQEPGLVDARFWPPYHVYAHDLRTGETTRVSTNAAGEPGNATSSAPAISGDGRLVAFQSIASNLVPGVDPDETLQLFLADRSTGEVRLVSRGIDGRPGNGRVLLPDISADGRVVVFPSLASNLVPRDRNEVTDVFAYDVATGSIELVSVSTDGHQQQIQQDAGHRLNTAEMHARVSGDGRYVAFQSPADNLSARDEPRTAAPNCTSCFDDVFVRDREAGTTLLVSVNSRGEQANNYSFLAGLSPNGAEVVFLSPADNLVDDDTNGGTDLFVHAFGGGS